MGESKRGTGIEALALALLVLPQVSLAKASGSPAQSDGTNVADEAMSKLDKKQFKDEKVSGDSNGIATFSGTVDWHEYRLDADTRIHKVKARKALGNEL